MVYPYNYYYVEYQLHVLGKVVNNSAVDELSIQHIYTKKKPSSMPALAFGYYTIASGEKCSYVVNNVVFRNAIEGKLPIKKSELPGGMPVLTC